MRRALVIAVSAAVVIALVVWTASTGGRFVFQPIPFNHKIHIQSVGLDCGDCHQHYNQIQRAGIPNISLCGDCHSEVIGESAAEAEVVRHIEEEVPIPWRRVNRVPEHVYFSHARHVKVGRLECARCHGPMEDRDKPLRKPYKKLKMSWCMDCHETLGAPNDCLNCHR